MNTYRVTWEIDLIANTPREAAEKALSIQLDPGGLATVFSVRSLEEINPPTVQLDLLAYKYANSCGK